MANIERLKKLARSTAEANPDNFCMGLYTDECGTPSCVLGNYAARSDLNEGRFKLVTIQEMDGYLMVLPFLDGQQAGTDSEALWDWFGITGDESFDLFSSNGCGFACTPDQAVDYINAFIAKKEGEL